MSHIQLAGGPLIIGAGRFLTVRGNSSVGCASAPPFAVQRAIPAGLCILDAQSLSRHFEVRTGAELRLSGLALLRGQDTMGGSVLAVAASINASGCLFADSTATGESPAYVMRIRSVLTCERPGCCRRWWRFAWRCQQQPCCIKLCAALSETLSENDVSSIQRDRGLRYICQYRLLWCGWRGSCCAVLFILGGFQQHLLKYLCTDWRRRALI